ncbi:MAG: hypothetical protein DME02_09145 [Candidatus Rokuibacteriota bacterium]|nr:MAG: hypothetical protein DME02_09145 [Candidatus Rokubacteria bacterium]
MLARVYLRLARLVHWQVGMASSRRDVLSRLQPLLQVVILAFGLFCLGIAQDVFIPIALAMLLTFVLSPIVERLQHWHVPRVAAVVVTVVFAFSVLGGLGWLLASQATTLAADLPQYKHNLTRKIREVRRVGKSDSLEKAQSAVKEVIGELQKDGSVAAKKPPQPVVVEKPAPGGLDSFRVTLTTKILSDAADRIGRYLQAQSLINTGFGVTIATGLFLIGVPYALLFGVLGAVLRFVPYVGVWVAAGSAALVSLAVSDGWREPLMVLTLFTLVELLIYLVVEPLLYSHSAGVSPLALLITLAFWTWLWGPIGLILGTPLTVCLVALGRHLPEMQFIVVLFGDEPVVSTDVAVYQRLLKGDEDGARAVLAQYVKEHPTADVYEEALLPVLARVRRDASRGALTAQESAFITGAIRRVVDESEDGGRPAAQDEAAAAPVLEALACPARDEVDAAALRMLAARVATEGVRLDVADAGVLAAEVLERVEAMRPGVVVVASVAANGLGHARYVLKRLRARFADLPLVATCWSAPDEADEARAALVDAGATDVATTLGEARDRIVQYRRVRAEPAPPRAA